MYVTLNSLQANGSSRAIELPEGKVIRVGRDDTAELAFPDDPYMSSLHFAIGYRDGQCHIANFSSNNGTFVNGAQIQKAIVNDGDLIFAGQMKFCVRIGTRIEDLSAGNRPNSTTNLPYAIPVLNSATKHPVEILSAAPGEHLFALLDAARDDRVLELLHNSGEQHQSLYEGQQGEDLANFAPYLVAIPKHSPFLATLLKEGWGKSWGVYLTSTESFHEVRKHFRHYLLVQTEDGRQLYFRFYDPRILRDFLPACEPKETIRFFGPIQSFLVEDENPEILLRFK